MTPAALLPHATPMVLLDTIRRADATGAAATLTVRGSDRFTRPGYGVPAHVAIEWMAQTCGIFAGAEAASRNEPVRLGLLLGTRRFLAKRPWFVPGEHLTVEVTLVLREAGMGVFDCTVRDVAGDIRAAAQLTTFQPPDPPPSETAA